MLHNFKMKNNSRMIVNVGNYKEVSVNLVTYLNFLITLPDSRPQSTSDDYRCQTDNRLDEEPNILLSPRILYYQQMNFRLQAFRLLGSCPKNEKYKNVTVKHATTVEVFAS